MSRGHSINKRYPGIALIALWLLVSTAALAHIKNEATQFPDIEFSDSRFDIVVLVGAGIIPETPVFEPDKVFSQKDLATWAALAESLLSGGETPDIDALAEASLEQGLVESLQGTASVADIDRLFFSGNLGIEDGERTLTKAQAASLIATGLDSDAGVALLEKRRLATGVSGDVTAVVIEEGHHGNAYVMTIGGMALQMDEHGRVANGPTDLLQWEGRSIRRSFVRGSGEHAKWMYLEAAPREVSQASTPAAAVDGTPVEPTVAADDPAPPVDRSLLYWLIAAVVILGVVLFFRRRQVD